MRRMADRLKAAYFSVFRRFAPFALELLILAAFTVTAGAKITAAGKLYPHSAFFFLLSDVCVLLVSIS